MRRIVVALEDIRISKKRTRGISDRRVDEIIDEIESGREMHPIRLSQLHDGTYTVEDGRHRVTAHRILGFGFIEALVENSTERLKRLWGRFAALLGQSGLTPQGA